MAYAIGLDCGITSVGYAVVELNSDEEPKRIIRLGSRIFTAAENPKDGSSLAAPRREKRGLRRRLRRHRHRNERIRQLIINENILSEIELSELFDGQLEDIYALRTTALDHVVTNAQFARIMINLAQRRGFKSNRKVDSQDKEKGKLLTAVGENAILMQEKGYRTVGEMLYKDAKFAEFKRNKGESYTNTVSRDMVADEIRKIFAAQRACGNPIASEALEEKYLSIVLSQRSFDDGPGGDSKYGGDQIEKMIGNCTLIPEEKRAVKASYSFQIFTLWQNINNIRILCNGMTRTLTDDERLTIFNLAHKSPSLTYGKMRKELNLSDNEYFGMLSYGEKEIADVEKAKFEYLKQYHEIRKALDKVTKGRITALSVQQLNAIGYIFTVYKNDEKIEAALHNLRIEEADIACLMSLSGFRKVGHISVAACDKLIPFLEKGMRYNDACDAAGFDFKGHKKDTEMFLPAYSSELEDLNNPVVRRAVSQTIKVINAIIREQNESPMFINIELAREMSKCFDERNKIKKSMDENRARNERILETIRTEYGIANATGFDIVKYRLWQEQDCKCAYSLKPISIEDLFSRRVEVDHIIPYSISFDDSYNNKVLVLSAENQQKGNRLPLQYLTGTARNDFIVWTKSQIRNYKKRQNLLKERLTDADTDGFKTRHLNDTKYLSRFLLNYINDHLEFAESHTGRKKRVTAVNGSVTAYMRKRWGISKIREDGDLHHAADAAVIVCVTDAMIRKISYYAKYRELKYCKDNFGADSLAVDSDTGEVVGEFPYPWHEFRKELEIRLSNDPQSIIHSVLLQNYTAEEQLAIKPCFVSRMPTRKTKGAAHKETVRSSKLTNEGLVLSKVSLKSLKLDKDGEIAGYYNPDSDRLLYEALKNRLVQFGNNGEKAFAEPFYKPTSSGKPGPVVKKVKIYEKSSLNVAVNDGKGVANNDTMVRIDVFHVENDGYYFVPIYVADTVKPELPNKAVVAGKDWKVMDDKDFIFSLYPNDLIRVVSSKGIKMTLKFKESTLPKECTKNDILLYYTGADISVAAISGVNHDNSYLSRGIGIKRLQLIEKYEVDVLGNYHKVGKETRQGFGG